MDYAKRRAEGTPLRRRATRSLIAEKMTTDTEFIRLSSAAIFAVKQKMKEYGMPENEIDAKDIMDLAVSILLGIQ